jgi:hypothetical protein
MAHALRNPRRGISRQGSPWRYATSSDSGCGRMRQCGGWEAILRCGIQIEHRPAFVVVSTAGSNTGEFKQQVGYGMSRCRPSQARLPLIPEKKEISDCNRDRLE